jgi:hypothetical protein
MHRPFVYALAIVALGRMSAHADGALEEISAGNAPHAQGAPSSTWIADKLAGMWEPGDDWQLRLDVTGTRYVATKASASSEVVLANLSVEYDPTPHWILRLAAGGSPSSTAASTTSVQMQDLRGTPITADAKLETSSSSVSGSAWLGYETAGDGAVETSAITSASVTQLTSRQDITSLQGRNGQMVTLDQLRTTCTSHPCANGLGAALDGQSANLTQLVLGAGISEQLYQDTDVGLDGSYYLYDKDPAQAGTFTVTRAGQTAAAGGIGIAPVLYSVTPSLAHRFGPVMAMSSVSYSEYVEALGYAVTATLRIQYRRALGGSRRLKLWAKLTGSRDVDPMSAVSKAGAVTLGVQYAW